MKAKASRLSLAQLAQCAAQKCAGACAREYQRRSRDMLDAEDYSQRHRACRCSEREKPCRRRR